jgi:hypothetical protein
MLDTLHLEKELDSEGGGYESFGVVAEDTCKLFH